MSFDTLIDELTKYTGNMTIKCDKERVELKDYNQKIHWNKMGLACQAISKECTKMALAFSKPPLPSESDTQMLLRDVALAVDVLLAWFKTYPRKEGKVIHKKLEACVTNLMQSIIGFLSSYCKSSNDSKKSKLISTGTVWECCDSFKLLPQDNVSAVIQELNVSYNLLTDVLAEVNELCHSLFTIYHNHLCWNEEDQLDITNKTLRRTKMLTLAVRKNISESTSEDEDYSNEEERWSEEEKLLVKPCVGLLMAAKGLVKKIKLSSKTMISTESEVVDADKLSELFEEFGSCVDDLILNLYPPIGIENVITNVQKLSELLTSVINFLRTSPSYSKTDNVTWIDFIEKAILHNQNKFLLLIKNNKYA